MNGLKISLKKIYLKIIFRKDSEIFKLNIFNRNKLVSRYLKFCDQKVNKGTISFREIFYPLALEIWLRSNKKYINSV